MRLGAPTAKTEPDVEAPVGKQVAEMLHGHQQAQGTAVRAATECGHQRRQSWGVGAVWLRQVQNAAISHLQQEAHGSSPDEEMEVHGI